MIDVLFQLLMYPGNGDLGQCYEVKVSPEHGREIVLRVVTVVCYDLGLFHAESRQLLYRIFNAGDVRKIPRLLRKSHRLSGLYGVESQQLDGIVPIVILIESLPCFRKLLRVCRDRRGIISKRCLPMNACASAQEEVLLQSLIKTDATQQIVNDVFVDAIFIRQWVRQLKSDDPRQRLTV